MRRRLFFLASLLSLLLCGALAAIWIGGFKQGGINWPTRLTSHVGVGVISQGGAVTFWRLRENNGIDTMSVRWDAHAEYVLGVGWPKIAGNRWATGRIRVISAPGCLWVLTTAILPAIWFAVAKRRWRALKPHQCQQCGYDLTGNISGTCPECGAACKAADPAGVSPAAGD